MAEGVFSGDHITAAREAIRAIYAPVARVGFASGGGGPPFSGSLPPEVAARLTDAIKTLRSLLVTHREHRRGEPDSKMATLADYMRRAGARANNARAIQSALRQAQSHLQLRCAASGSVESGLRWVCSQLRLQMKVGMVDDLSEDDRALHGCVLIEIDEEDADDDAEAIFSIEVFVRPGSGNLVRARVLCMIGEQEIANPAIDADIKTHAERGLFRTLKRKLAAYQRHEKTLCANMHLGLDARIDEVGRWFAGGAALGLPHTRVFDGHCLSLLAASPLVGRGGDNQRQEGDRVLAGQGPNRSFTLVFVGSELRRNIGVATSTTARAADFDYVFHLRPPLVVPAAALHQVLGEKAGLSRVVYRADFVATDAAGVGKTGAASKSGGGPAVCTKEKGNGTNSPFEFKRFLSVAEAVVHEGREARGGTPSSLATTPPSQVSIKVFSSEQTWTFPASAGEKGSASAGPQAVQVSRLYAPALEPLAAGGLVGFLRQNAALNRLFGSCTQPLEAASQPRAGAVDQTLSLRSFTAPDGKAAASFQVESSAGFQLTVTVAGDGAVTGMVGPISGGKTSTLSAYATNLLRTTGLNLPLTILYLERRINGPGTPR